MYLPPSLPPNNQMTIFSITGEREKRMAIFGFGYLSFPFNNSSFLGSYVDIDFLSIWI